MQQEAHFLASSDKINIAEEKATSHGRIWTRPEISSTKRESGGNGGRTGVRLGTPRVEARSHKHFTRNVVNIDIIA